MRIDSRQAIRTLLSGGVVALPTETVYGLAASLRFPEAIKKVFTLKGRPSDNPLIIHIGEVDQLSLYVNAFPPQFEKLAQTFWPGPLTIVLEADQRKVPEIVRAGLSTVAIRVPDHEETRKILMETGALVMPSANISGRPSSTTAQHVIDDFGEALPVVEGGSCQQGLESTILIYLDSKWVIARQGSVTADAIAEVIGYSPVIGGAVSKPICPGQLYKHYSPKALLKPLKEGVNGVVVGFSDRKYPNSTGVYTLGRLSEPQKVAENLYAILRKLDADNVPIAYIDWNFPDKGLWTTIRERLRKASHE